MAQIRPAISDQPNLRLREEWRDIDAHQKTVLSDDLGMGFTTCLLAHVLDFRSFADTQYFVNVVECKGTQGSIQSLVQSVVEGVKQKRNLWSAGGGPIALSLVAGLFVPQWSSNEEALIYIRDPDWEGFADALAQVSNETLVAGIVQIDLAKHFALMGLPSIASVLSSKKTSELASLPNSVREEERFLDVRDDNIFFETDHPLPLGAMTSLGMPVRRLRFTMSCPLEFYNRFVESDDLAGEVSHLGMLLVSTDGA